jgi:CDP-glucose 4,6-dehydratase
MFDAFYRGKRVLVTGHTGFKGSWLCQWLLMMGAEVAGVSKDIPTNPSLFESLQLTTQMHDHRVDIEQYEPLLAVLQSFRPEVVFHLAAQPIVSEAYDNPLGTYSANLMGTVNMLEAVKQAGCVQQLVMITSDKCYHNVEWGYGYRENDRLGGKDPYSASKACAEIAIHSYWHSYYRSSSTALASARAGNVIGGGDWAMSRIVPDCMRQWSEGKPMNLRSPQATRPWQHVLEPLSGYLWLAKCLADNPAISGEAYNFGPNPKSE